MPLSNDATARIFPAQGQKASQPAASKHLPNQVRERSQHREERGRSNSSSKNRQPLHPQSTNRIDAASLKIDVPNTLAPKRPTSLKHQTSQSTLDDQEHGFVGGTQIKVEGSQRPVTTGGYQMYGGSNVDTTDITIGTEGWDSGGSESGEPTARRIPTQLNGFGLAPGWQHEVDTERRLQGQKPRYTTDVKPQRQIFNAQQQDDTISTFEDEDDEDVGESVRNLERATPSRPTLQQVTKQAPQQVSKPHVKFTGSTTRRPIVPERERQSSPIIPEADQLTARIAQLPELHQSSISRHINYKQHVDAIEPAPEPVKPVAAPPAPTISKVSAFHEPSEDEQLPEETASQPAAAVKRPFADIDYDLEDLKTKSYNDLDKTDFLVDPRAPEAPPSVDMNGTPLPLPKRLENLSKLQTDAQQSLFATLNDEENEEAGQWFVAKFQDELKKLMERRLERRKIALKFEDEVKRRHAIVHVKIGDVEEELKELRKGGGNLIEGRSVAGLGGTPKGK